MFKKGGGKIEKIPCEQCGAIRRWIGSKCLDQCQCNVEQRCHCGGVILADTEDWKTPLCYDCWENIGCPDDEPIAEEKMVTIP